MSESKSTIKLSQLRPKTRQRVMDLVAAAGVDVSDWANFSGGKKKAAANPKYCYEWSFVAPKKVIVLNLWYESMRQESGVVVQSHSLRESARMYQGLRGKTVWATRAGKMDQAIQAAVKDKMPIRVIVNDGLMRDRNDPNAKASRVTARMLDPEPWSVVAYDWSTGKCTLARGASTNRFADQFSIQEEPTKPPERRPISGQAFVRDPDVRRRALVRANGKCEWCKKPGFTMADGRVFLETHHIIPLAEDGLDTVSNVAALCPNHHREAHFGASSQRIKKELLSRVSDS